MAESIPVIPIPLEPTLEEKRAEALRKRVLQRLDSLGYPSQEADSRFLDILTEKVLDYAKSITNQKKLPEHLDIACSDLICAEFLQMSKDTGSLPDGEFTREIQQIQEGDTNVVFDSGKTKEQVFDLMIAKLSSDAKQTILRARRIAW